MRRQGEDTLERYGASLFYGAGPELQPTRSANNFGATYSNGQARPVTGLQAPTTPRPVTRVPPVQQTHAAVGARNENWGGGDGISFSLETQEERNGASHGGLEVRPTRRASRGNAVGPVYSNDFRRSLDALLNGPSTVF